MGAWLSSVVGSEGDGVGGLGDLPEGCIAEVLRRLDAPDICQLMQINRTFLDAGSSDFIWEEKLPRNYGYLVKKALEGEEKAKGLGANTEKLRAFVKKDVYALLCRRNSFDGGNKEFWLDKSTGGICMQISSKALSITGIDDRRYWNYIPIEESRFGAVAYLVQIWWLEVRGEIEFPFPEGTYSLFFRLHLGKPSKRLGRRSCITDNIHGWDMKPVRFQLSTLDGQQMQSKAYLAEPGVWSCHHVGDFVVNRSDEVTRVKFSLVQIDCTHTKGGLCVDSVLIEPKGLRQDNMYCA
ncbi:F-box protein PP2-A13 [Rhynchospora pubera]|uniref:F-box protein PP2-A13 n=1 Tax=Rhynchospora pubera TaxID=906938 RepID=A0AAV8GFP3_9POAL|nr:F-box protein PP2-A13 [Rhynchospora pubera]